MSKPCPNCGARTVPEARFCRLCGTPLRVTGGHGTDAPVSPIARTIPLSGEGRATGGLNADDGPRASSNTARVGRTEMERLLGGAEPGREAARDGGRRSGEQTSSAATQATEPAPSASTTTLAPERAAASQETAQSPLASSSPSTAKGAGPSPNTRARRMWQVAAAGLLFVALVAGILAFVLARGSNPSAGDSTSPIPLNDHKQLVDERLAEARVLMDAGEFNRAVEILRSVVKLDPSSGEARMLLGNALEKTGARAEAIEEYRAAALSNSGNASAWRALASAQYEERLYNDAAESYRRLLLAVGNAPEDEAWLPYADALRLAGRIDEARAAYQKAAASSNSAAAQAARQRLAEMGPAVAANNEDRTRAEQHERGVDTTASPQPTPSPAASPAQAPTPAIAGGADYDSYYFQAMNILNGRDPKGLERAELLRALGLFQRAALGGAHRAEAQRYADRLGKEYDRRRKL